MTNEKKLKNVKWIGRVTYILIVILIMAHWGIEIYIANIYDNVINSDEFLQLYSSIKTLYTITYNIEKTLVLLPLLSIILSLIKYKEIVYKNILKINLINFIGIISICGISLLLDYTLDLTIISFGRLAFILYYLGISICVLLGIACFRALRQLLNKLKGCPENKF